MFKIVAMLVGMPLGFTIIFGLAYAENVLENISLTICDEDQTVLSRNLISMYADSEKFKIVSYVTTEEAMRQEISDGRAKAALVIPKNFSRDIKFSKGAEILFIVNSSNNVFGNAALTAVQEINKTFSVAVAQKLFEAQNLLPAAAMSAAYPIQLGVRIFGNPTNGYSPFMLSGLLLNGLQIGIMMAIVPLFNVEYARRRFSPLKEKLPVAAKLLPYEIISLCGYLISIAVMENFFAIPRRGSWLDAAILGGGFIFFVSNVLLIFAAAAPNKVLALQAPMIYIMPGLLYSGLSFPVFDMGAGAEFLSRLMPMSYAGDNLRDILLTGYAPNLWQDFWTMILYGLIGLTIATGIFLLKGARGSASVTNSAA